MPVHASKEPKKRFILPFTTLGANRFKDFTRNMETAAVLYLAESNRKKGESQLLKKTDEKLVFIAEACYPIWLVPYNKETLMFDGLGLTSHTLSYDLTPDAEIFTKDIRRNQKTTEAYTATLTRNIDYFRNIKDKEEIKIKGLVTTPDLKEAFRNYLPLMKETKKPSITKVILKPTIKAHEIQAGTKQISTLMNQIDKEIKNMEATMKLLNMATTQRAKTIKDEIKKIRETQHQKIKTTKLKSTRKLRQIQNRYNQKISKTSKKFKKKFLRLYKNQIKLKKTYKNLNKEAKRYQTRLNSNRHLNRKQSKHQWTLKLERIKKGLLTLRKQIKANTKRIHDAENAQKHELAKQRKACRTRIQSVNKKFRDLQGSREAEIIMKRQEIANLEEITRLITKSIQNIIQNKKLFKVQFDKITMPRETRARRMVYMPFYLARYEKVDKKRYAIYPPAIIGDMGILIKMKGALGAAKVKALVQSRSEATAAFLNQLPALFEKKPMLEKDVTEEGIQKSILLRNRLRAGVAKGLKELENENWISKSELRAFNKILFMYASLNKRINAKLIPEKSCLKCLPA
jgi:hypothetical protein